MRAIFFFLVVLVVGGYCEMKADERYEREANREYDYSSYSP